MSDDSGSGYLILAVHYDKPTLKEVQDYFAGLGFVGIRGLHKDPEPINCNDARTRVREQAGKEGARWHYNGSWDANTGSPCRLYRFWCDLYPDERG